MKILAHDEDSMTNLFFSEVQRHDRLNAFLDIIEWRSHPALPFTVSQAEIHQQVNLSEFGRPDATIIIKDQAGLRHIVIVEVKLGAYLECCMGTKLGKFDNKFNSKLNNQLALRYRAMQSMGSIVKNGYIVESGHAADSPYHEDQIRRCKKPGTITLFRHIAIGGFQFYLVTLTSDNTSPLSKDTLNPSDPCFPLLYDHNSRSMVDFSNLGSVSWSKCLNLFDETDSHFRDSFGLHFGSAAAVEESEGLPKPEELFVKGRQIVRYGDRVCHLSCKGYSFSIRHFRNGKFVEIDRGKSDREKYLALKDQITVLSKAPAKPVDDVAFWKEFFSSD